MRTVPCQRGSLIASRNAGSSAIKERVAAGTYRGSLRNKGERLRRDSSRIAPYRRGAGAAFFVGQRLNDCSIDQSFKRERGEKNSRVAARAGESGERNFRVTMGAGESGKRALARRSRRGKEHSRDDGRGREERKGSDKRIVSHMRGERKRSRVQSPAYESGRTNRNTKPGRTGGGRYEKGFQTERT